MTRKNGFYWVKRCGNWIICEWGTFDNHITEKYWFIPGFETWFNDDDFDEIDENLITRPEQPVLTPYINTNITYNAEQKEGNKEAEV